jgi:hypothetical protein
MCTKCEAIQSFGFATILCVNKLAIVTSTRKWYPLLLPQKLGWCEQDFEQTFEYTDQQLLKKDFVKQTTAKAESESFPWTWTIETCVH